MQHGTAAFLRTVLNPRSTWKVPHLLELWCGDRKVAGDFLAEHALRIGVVVAAARCHTFAATTFFSALTSVGADSVDLSSRAEAAIEYMCESSTAYPQWIVLVQKEMDNPESPDAYRWRCYERFVNARERGGGGGGGSGGCRGTVSMSVPVPAEFVRGRRGCWYPASFDGWNTSRAFRFFCLKLLVQASASAEAAVHAFRWVLGLVPELDPAERILVDFASSPSVSVVQKVGLLWNILGASPRRDVLDYSLVSCEEPDVVGRFEHWWDNRWRPALFNPPGDYIPAPRSRTLFARRVFPCAHVVAHDTALRAASDFEVVCTDAWTDGVMATHGDVVCSLWAERVLFADWLREAVFGMRRWGVCYAPEGHLVVPAMPTGLLRLHKLTCADAGAHARHADRLRLSWLLHVATCSTSVFVATFEDGREAIVDLPAASSASATSPADFGWGCELRSRDGDPVAELVARAERARSSVPIGQLDELERAIGVLRRAADADAQGS